MTEETNTPQGCPTFHFANISKCKCSKAPGQTKKRLFPPKLRLPLSETAPTKMRSSILSIPPHPCNSHCSLLTNSRALVFSPGFTQLLDKWTWILPPEFCAVGASWAGSWMRPRAPGKDLPASWQQLPIGSLELLAKLQPNRMLLTPM